MSFRINDGSGRGLGSGLGGARVVSADTTVRTLPDDFDPNKLRAMLTANGGEKSRNRDGSHSVIYSSVTACIFPSRCISPQ